MTPLSAFWHKTRRQYVPLTGTEWEARAKISDTMRRSLHRDGMVTAHSTSGRDRGETIYEITQAGIDAHCASLIWVTQHDRPHIHPPAPPVPHRPSRAGHILSP